MVNLSSWHHPPPPEVAMPVAYIFDGTTAGIPRTRSLSHSSLSFHHNACRCWHLFCIHLLRLSRLRTRLCTFHLSNFSFFHSPLPSLISPSEPASSLPRSISVFILPPLSPTSVFLHQSSVTLVFIASLPLPPVFVLQLPISWFPTLLPVLLSIFGSLLHASFVLLSSPSSLSWSTLSLPSSASRLPVLHHQKQRLAVLASLTKFCASQ